jgi:hypothetical protein
MFCYDVNLYRINLSSNLPNFKHYLHSCLYHRLNENGPNCQIFCGCTYWLLTILSVLFIHTNISLHYILWFNFWFNILIYQLNIIWYYFQFMIYLIFLLLLILIIYLNRIINFSLYIWNTIRIMLLLLILFFRLHWHTIIFVLYIKIFPFTMNII